MNETDYSIDEVKLMAKVKRYKRRWKEQRHYSEYLKCKLAKKAMQVQELKAEAAKWHDTALQLSANRGAAGYEIDSLKLRIAELETMVERLIEAIESGCDIRVGPEPDINGIQKWYEKMRTIIAEWKEMQR